MTQLSSRPRSHQRRRDTRPYPLAADSSRTGDLACPGRLSSVARSEVLGIGGPFAAARSSGGARSLQASTAKADRRAGVMVVTDPVANSHGATESRGPARAA
jgi:hypothetical protein